MVSRLPTYTCTEVLGAEIQDREGEEQEVMCENVASRCHSFWELEHQDAIPSGSWS